MWNRPAAFCRSIDTTRRLRRTIEALAAINAGAVTILQNQLFVFEDVIRIDDREFQVLLGRVDNQTLARAMMRAGDAVRRFFGKYVRSAVDARSAPGAQGRKGEQPETASFKLALDSGKGGGGSTR